MVSTRRTYSTFTLSEALQLVPSDQRLFWSPDAAAGHETDVYGIVTTGPLWQFYRLTQQNEVLETAFYPLNNLLELLGRLNNVCAACAATYVPVDVLLWKREHSPRLVPGASITNG